MNQLPDRREKSSNIPHFKSKYMYQSSDKFPEFKRSPFPSSLKKTISLFQKEEHTEKIPKSFTADLNVEFLC